MSSAVGGSRRSFYYTMNYEDADVDVDDLSPNKNQISCECTIFSLLINQGDQMASPFM